MRARMWPALSPDEIRTTNWAAIANAAADAFAKGWTGFEVGSAAIEGLGRAENVGALMVTNIRRLAEHEPLRTPTPPPVAAVIRPTEPVAQQPSQWAQRIRQSRREDRQQ